MMRYLPLLFLTACASPPPVAVPIEVRVPVEMPCHTTPIAEPTWPILKIRPSDTLATKERAIIAEIQTHMGYEDLLKAALAQCQ